MRYLATALAFFLGPLLTAPAAAQSSEGLTIHEGLVLGKWSEEGHVVLDIAGTSGDGVLEVVCPPARDGDLLAETCDMIEIGDIASTWECLPPDQDSSFPTLHRLALVTLGHHQDHFAIYDGVVTGREIEGGRVVLDLAGGPRGIVKALCPLNEPGNLLAEACSMIEVGDVASLWDGRAPDPTTDFPTLHRLTSVTVGISLSQVFIDGFESGDTLAWSSAAGQP